MSDPPTDRVYEAEFEEIEGAASNPSEAPPTGGSEPNSSHAHDTTGFTEQQKDFYQSLRRSVRDWLKARGKGFKYADVLLVAPDMFHLLCRLVVDPRIPAIDKAKVAGAIAYFISPVGVIPEAITGPIGYIDDIALSAFVLSSLLNSDQADVVREHWAGDEDVLKVVQQVLEVAENAIGIGLFRRRGPSAPPPRR